jgi:hypothetical protein
LTPPRPPLIPATPPFSVQFTSSTGFDRTSVEEIYDASGEQIEDIYDYYSDNDDDPVPSNDYINVGRPTGRGQRRGVNDDDDDDDGINDYISMATGVSFTHR